ncbi:MAG: penicillin-binding protein 2 [Paracoccaceae bacterium]|jgi:penicillin-binding protein 2|nr:penicillin-binding protein 2 [Paracoccaceae bacterium]MDG2452585.1 penicillin-binding protein 2 [Paracoccaceae bacterium]
MRRGPRDTAESARKISRRALVLGGAQTVLMGTLLWRMQSIQVDQGAEYRFLAEENRVKIRLIPPARGLIFDRAGRVLAENEQNYRIVMVREDAGDIGAVLQELTRLVALAPEDISRAIQEMETRRADTAVTIADRLTWDDIARVAANAPALPGVTAEVGLSRRYPMGADMAHIVGYVGPVSSYDLEQLENPDPLLRIPRFQLGKTGVESKMESQLRGAAGIKRIEINAAGRVMRELGREEGRSGADMQLTVDTKLQNYVQQRLGNDSASAVVIDVETGDVRAIASAPTFDPNMFVRGISVANWDALNERDTPRNQQKRPLAAKAVQGLYPPGSTFKMVTALAALEAGVVDPEETVRCPGHLEVADVKFHCWKRSGHGNINLHESLKQSCDVYYYDIAQRVGIDKISEMAKRLGLGVRHDLPLSAVGRGVAPDKAWKREVRDADWRIGDTVNASIGQGYVLSSPMQLAVMTARLATGRSVEPRLVQSIDGIEQPTGEGEPLGINDNLLRRVRSAMYDVSNHRRGTAFRSRIIADAFRMAGKTGTSQVRRITAEERARGVTRNEDLPWERRDHALFVSFAPYDNPKYAVAVVVEHGGGGSTAAAPIGRDVLLHALYDGLPPLEAYPSSERARVREQRRRMELRDFDAATESDRA